THTLRYGFTVLSLNESWQPLCRIVIYVDDELFLCYKGDNRSTGAWGVRMNGHAGADSWATEIEDLWMKKEQLGKMLAEVINHQGQSKGLHTLQVILGCELQGNQSIGGFWRLGYDGQDSLTFDQKTLTWKVAMPFTQQTKTFWETHAPRVDQVKTFLEDLCPSQLHGYLASLRNISLDSGVLPKVNITSKPYPVGRITLTCWVFNLYPHVATLTWLQNGKPAQQYTFGPGTILPSGDGTYQTRVSIWVLPGQEAEFTCHLRHQTHDIKVPAISGKKMGQPSTSEDERHTITTHFMADSRCGTKNINDAARSLSASAVPIFPIVLMVVLAGAN
ncbi:zinc-alpha-2-glycoprotein-like, partial [Sigmodon hispidus]